MVVKKSSFSLWEDYTLALWFFGAPRTGACTMKKILFILFATLVLTNIAAPTTMFSNNVGILCNPIPSQETPGVWWLWQGGPKTCMDNDPIDWAVGDFTGFYPAGDVTLSQRGVNRDWYGSQAVQFQGDTFGIVLHSASVLDSISTIDPIIIDYEYDKSTPPFPFADPDNRIVYSLQLQVASAHVRGPAVAHVVGYILLQDTKSRKDIWYGANIFDTRGAGMAKEVTMLDSCNFCTGWPIVVGEIGIDGAFTSNPSLSEPFQSAPWRGFKIFSFSISSAQMKSTITTLKAKYAEMQSLSGDPADYVLLSASLNAELSPLDPAQPFGPNVFATIGLSAKALNVDIR
jgi:hypothetical protein